eukprot:TRINITY_DN4780_c0_g1_i7.p1 TRINITY_DN4780_c0_g1~~TRINITY_DN4780_c0_g1_i7.p1  ORF type:complete len:224 (+),score=39.75 TRINITY_DN4780_c0_g1_i7:50-721(+)
MSFVEDLLLARLSFDRHLQPYATRSVLSLLFVLFCLIAYRSDYSGYPKGGPLVTHHVYFDVAIDGKGIGRFVIGVFGETCPNTTLNFVTLATGEKGFGYRGSKIHRIVKNFVIQAGDFTKGDGSGGRSIFADRWFPHENHKVSHYAAGMVSMANAGKDKNSSQFFIVFKPTPWLDPFHTVFGKVVEGWSVLERINRVPTGLHGIPDRPLQEVVITNSGVLNRR